LTIDDLHRSETIALLRAYRENGDAAARERLVERHLPLVRALAGRFAHRGERYEDLVQVGAIGLIEAIDRFDPARGRDLIGFAVPTICGEIRRHLRDRCAVVRVPRRLAELTSTLRPASQLLTARLGRTPTRSELAAEVGTGEGDVALALAADRASSPASLSDPADRGVTASFGLAVDGGFAVSERRLLLAAAFRAIGPRERRILHLRFFAGLSQAEIADEVGLSQIQVSRLIRSSLDRLRAALGATAWDAEPVRPAA
jgi:RNA polymerase sigma-B factor